MLGCYLQPRLPRERGSHEHYDPGAFNQAFDETFYLGITAIFKDFAVYLVVIILGTFAVTSYLPVAFAVILPDETYYLEEMHQPPTNAGGPAAAGVPAGRAARLESRRSCLPTEDVL